MSNLLVAESVLDDGVSVLEFLGSLLLDDVAAHVQHLLLRAFEEGEVLDGLFSPVEQRLCRDDLSIEVLHLQPAVLDTLEIFAEHELHIHPHSPIEIFVVPKVDVTSEFPSNAIIYRSPYLHLVGNWGSIIKISLGFGEVHEMGPVFGKV